jgi:hypothetical protein
MPLGTGTFYNTQSKMRIIISQHQQDIFNETYTKGKYKGKSLYRLSGISPGAHGTASL